MLSLSVVKDLLDRHEYRTVFTLMRNHRIDFNLFYDHNPHDFLSVAPPPHRLVSFVFLSLLVIICCLLIYIYI
jgi:hypothetical protein